jgi:hypothetical protein
VDLRGDAGRGVLACGLVRREGFEIGELTRKKRMIDILVDNNISHSKFLRLFS